MELQVSEADGITKVALSGRMDTIGTSQIETRFTALIVPGGKPTIIDLSEVSFLASLGVRMLISTARALSRKGSRMALFGATEPVMEIIDTTSLDQIIPVAPSEPQAIALVQG